MIWKLFDFIPVVGPVIGTIGKYISLPIAKLTCWVSSQPDHVVNAVCVGLSGQACR